jgi:hypothetical protein
VIKHKIVIVFKQNQKIKNAAEIRFNINKSLSKPPLRMITIVLWFLLNLLIWLLNETVAILQVSGFGYND